MEPTACKFCSVCEATWPSFALQRFERDEIQLGGELPGNEPLDELAGDVYGGFPRSGAASPEMDEAQMRAALHHFVGGHCGIESAGEQAHETACGVWRESAGTEDAARVDEQRSASDFDAAGERGRF